MDLTDIFAVRVRALQGLYPEAHKALACWGAWSRDDPQRPQGIRSPSIWDEAKDENEEWGERDDAPVVVEPTEDAKAEAREKEAYNALQGEALDQRMHGPGGLPDYIRLVLRVAYVYTVPEFQYVREAKNIGRRWELENAGCTEDAFCERLEAGLRFAGRFL